MPTCYRHPDRETYIRCQRCNRPICPDCMRDASVGFQCPSCVAEGAKATRAGRTAYGGLRSGNPGLTSLVLIGMNVAVWLAIIATGWRASSLVNRLALIPEGRCVVADEPDRIYSTVPSSVVCDQIAGARWFEGVGEGAYWQLLTSAFTQVEIWHIGFNMLALWFIGPQLEMVLGRMRFLALYVLSALSASALVYLLADGPLATLGASGAIFGLVGALLVVGYKVGGDLRGILGWLAAMALISVVFRSYISWQGHLGGFVGGLLIAVVLVYAPRQRRTSIQAAGLTLIALVVLATIVARTVTLA